MALGCFHPETKVQSASIHFFLDSGENNDDSDSEEEEEDAVRRRKVPLVKLDFSAANDGEKAKERLERIKASVPSDKETLFKAKVRWDCVTDVSLFSI